MRFDRRSLLAGALLSGVVPAVADEEPVVRKVTVGQLPTLVVSPPVTRERYLIVWLPGFSGTKEGTERTLREFAKRGYVGMSFDSFQHGERRIEPQPELVSRVRGNIRRYFWPILARTAEEVPQVITWAIRELGVRPEVGMGGTSMGGDISVTAAAVDHRIKAVSALVATPDWMRPGSFEPPGEPDTAAQADYDRRNPLTHLDAYRHRPAIAFQSGDVDKQVPPDGGDRFVAALKQGAYRGHESLLVVNRFPNVAHAVVPQMMDATYEWFDRHLRGRR